jgi:hypothetical protein
MTAAEDIRAEFESEMKATRLSEHGIQDFYDINDSHCFSSCRVDLLPSYVFGHCVMGYQVVAKLRMKSCGCSLQCEWQEVSTPDNNITSLPT